MALPRTLRQPVPTGRILSPLPDAFKGMSKFSSANPDRFYGAQKLGETWVRNTSKPNVGDGHDTMTTGRDDDTSLNSTTFVAFNWLYETAADLKQVGRNLFFQTQMKGSPIDAVSTAGGKLEFVWRNPTTMHRDPLGLIPWGHELCFFIGTKIAKTGGFVECWYEVDGWPDLNGSPDHRHANINTWQGDRAHHTIGHYRTPTQGGIYIGYFNRFGRDTTPQGALARATG